MEQKHIAFFSFVPKNTIAVHERDQIWIRDKVQSQTLRDNRCTISRTSYDVRNSRARQMLASHLVRLGTYTARHREKPAVTTPSHCVIFQNFWSVGRSKNFDRTNDDRGGRAPGFVIRTTRSLKTYLNASVTTTKYTIGDFDFLPRNATESTILILFSCRIVYRDCVVGRCETACRLLRLFSNKSDVRNKCGLCAMRCQVQQMTRACAIINV